MAVGEPGFVVAGRYVLRREVGRGGMGVVWHAHDQTLDRDVAIKEILASQQLAAEEREQAHARFLREARTAARIPHPSVITVHDIVDHDDRPWVVMELVNGHSLQDLLRTEGPITPRRAHAVAEAILGALGAAHRMGVVHRDIKPANIMLAEDDRIILTDFGIAAMDSGTSLTRTGTMVGSPEYMAPERLEGENTLPASDVWSLGVTLHAVLDGQSPFRRDTLTGTISAVVGMPVPPTRNAGHLAPFIGAMLDRDHHRRPNPDQCLELLRQSSASAAPGTGPGTGPVMASGRGTGPAPGSGPVTGPRTGPVATPGPGTGPHTAAHHAPAMAPPPARPAPPPAHHPPAAAYHPPTPHAAPASPYGPPTAPPAPPQHRGRRLWILGGAGIVVAVLALVITIVLVLTRPLTTSYEQYEDADFALEYPAGWDYFEWADSDLSPETVLRAMTFNDPTGDLWITISLFENEFDNSAAQEVRYLLDNESELPGYQLLSSPTLVDRGYPAEWSAAETSYELTDDTAARPDRSVDYLVIMAEGNGYGIFFNTPQDEVQDYRQIRDDVLDSFRPQV